MSDLHICSVCGERADELVHASHSRELSAGPPIRVCNSTKRDITYIHVVDE